MKQDGAAPGGSALIVSRLQAGKTAFSSVSLSYFLFLSHPNAGTVQLETLEMGIFAIWLITQGTLEKGGGSLNPCGGVVDNEVKQLAWHPSVWVLSASWDQGRKTVSLTSSAVFEKHKVKVRVGRFFSRASDSSASSHWCSYTDVVLQDLVPNHRCHHHRQSHLPLPNWPQCGVSLIPLSLAKYWCLDRL